MKLDLENINLENVNISPIETIKAEEKEKSNNEKRLELFKKIEARAKLCYADIPYHNFEHACTSLELGYEIVARCQASNIEVDSDAVRYAILFHDAGYHENHKEKGFETKEEYSAHLAEENMRKEGVAEETIAKVKKSIISTHKDAEFNGLEDRIVRAADLAGLAGDYETFKANSLKLKDEYELLTGNKISWDVFKQITKEIIEGFLKQDIRLTECYKNEEGGSHFHKQTRKNLEQLLSE